MTRTLSFLWIVLLFTSICHAKAPDEPARVAISGQVVDEQSQPVPNIQVRGYAYDDETEATTDDDGRFVINVVEDRTRSLAILADDATGDRMGVFKADWQNPPDAETPIEISLADCQRLAVEVINAQGKPAAGARVGAIINYAPLVSIETDDAGRGVLRLPIDAEIQSLYAVKTDVGFDFRVVTTARQKSHQAEWLDESPVQFHFPASQSIDITLADADNVQPITNTEVSLWLLHKPGEPDSFNLSFLPSVFRVKTNDAGMAEFRGVPSWDEHPLTFWPTSKQYVHERIPFDLEEHPDGSLIVKLNRLVPLSGSVHFADGRPAAEVEVSIAGAGYELDSFRKVTKTDDEGRFEQLVAPNLLYMLVVRDEQWAAPVIDGFVVHPGKPIEGLEFELQPTTRVYGQVTVGPESKPVEGQRMSLSQNGRGLQESGDIELPNPEGRRIYVQPIVSRGATTDKEGSYEFFVGPGEFYLRGPSQVEPVKFEVTDEAELEFNFAAPRAEEGPFDGLVVDETGLPVANAKVVGIYRNMEAGRDLKVVADSAGKFHVTRELHRTVLYARNEDGTKKGVVEIAEDDSEAMIHIDPVASATGRLVDKETQQPLPREELRFGITVHLGDEYAPMRTAFGGSVTTDDEGKFKLERLVPGQKIGISVVKDEGHSYRGVGSVVAAAGEKINLGDLELSPPYEPPTFAERMEDQFASDKTPIERYEKALEEATRLRQHVLVVFLNREAPLTASWFKLRLDDSDVRMALADYQLVQLAVNDQGVAELAEQLEVKLDDALLPQWRFGDADGNALESARVPSKEEEIDQPVVLEKLAEHAPEPLDAHELLAEALAEAKKSDRLVIVEDTATWCGPCHKLAQFFEDNRSVWEKDYLWVQIDRRWHGSDEVMDEIYPDKRGGIPWFAIIDDKKNLLATSDGPNGNIGFPTSDEEIAHFLAMLETSMLRMTQEDLATLRKTLESQ